MKEAQEPIWRAKLYKKIETQTAKNERLLTKEQQRRLTKLNDITEQLRGGKNVQNRQLQRWLTESEFAELEEDWKAQRQFRIELKNKPDEIRKYEAILKKATFSDNRANAARAKGKSTAAAKFRNECERQCEQALEVLEGFLDVDPSLTAWFDRSVSFDADQVPHPSPVSMPHVVTSRSLDRQAGYANIMSKVDVKLAVVERAIQQLRLGH